MTQNIKKNVKWDEMLETYIWRNVDEILFYSMYLWSACNLRRCPTDKCIFFNYCFVALSHLN